MGIYNSVAGMQKEVFGQSRATATGFTNPRPIRHMGVAQITRLGSERADEARNRSQSENIAFIRTDAIEPAIDAFVRIGDALASMNQLAQDVETGAFTTAQMADMQVTFALLRTQIGNIVDDTARASLVRLLADETIPAALTAATGAPAITARVGSHANQTITVPARNGTLADAAGLGNMSASTIANVAGATASVTLLTAAIDGVSRELSELRASEEQFVAYQEILTKQADAAADKVSELTTPNQSELSKQLSEQAQRLQILGSLLAYSASQSKLSTNSANAVIAASAA